MSDSKEPGNPGGNQLPAPHEGGERGQLLAIPAGRAISLDVRAQEGADSDEIDLLSYWRILVKRRWTVLAATGIVLATALVLTLLTTPVYRASTSLQIDRNAEMVVEVGATSPWANWDGEFYDTQYELLRSRALAQRVAADLAGADPALLRRMTGTPEDEAAEADIAGQQARLAGLVGGGLTVTPVRDTKLVRLNFDSTDRDFAVRAANAVADAFIATTLERRFESTGYARTYLEERLAELKLRLEESERQLVAFAQQEQIVSTGDNTVSLSEQHLNTLNAAVAQARQDRIRAESRWRQAQSGQGPVLLGEAGANSIIQSLQQTRSQLMSEYQERLQRFKPDYPEMVQRKGQLDELDRQIAAEIGNIRGAIRAEYLAAQEQERLLEEQVAGLRTDVLDLQQRSIQYTIFKREVDTNRQLYDGLLQRYKEIGVAAGLTNNNISVVDRADAAARFKPNLGQNLLIGLLAGLALGVMLAFVFEFLDDTIKLPEDVEKQLGLAVLGMIPKLKSPQTPASAMGEPRSAFAESYRSVRTALQFATDAGVPRCLLVTSASQGEGKSTTAMALARNFAQLGKQVLLIDGDLRNPSMHRALGYDNDAGLSTYLAGAGKAVDLIHRTEIPNLLFLSSGPLAPNPAELLMSPKMLSLLRVAADKYDQVIIDGPPVMGLADGPILGNMATGTLLVIAAGETRIAVARNTLKRLLAARAHVIGALLSRFDAAQHGSYGYGYGAYDYYSYGSQEEKKKPKRLVGR